MRTLFILLLFTGNFCFSQVYGDIQEDKRKIVTDISYTLYANKTGQMVFDIIVNRQGKVTSCILNKDKTDITSTPTMMKCKNRIMQGLTFEVNYSAPERHLGEVLINIRPKTNLD